MTNKPRAFVRYRTGRHRLFFNAPLFKPTLAPEQLSSLELPSGSGLWASGVIAGIANVPVPKRRG